METIKYILLAIAAIAILVFNIFIVVKFIKQNLKGRSFTIKTIAFIIGLNFVAMGENYFANIIMHIGTKLFCN